MLHRKIRTTVVLEQLDGLAAALERCALEAHRMGRAQHFQVESGFDGTRTSYKPPRVMPSLLYALNHRIDEDFVDESCVADAKCAACFQQQIVLSSTDLVNTVYGRSKSLVICFSPVLGPDYGQQNSPQGEFK